ncbi:MAG: hypothetical protein QM784_09260 [Polyangiaceae bacterium]
MNPFISHAYLFLVTLVSVGCAGDIGGHSTTNGTGSVSAGGATSTAGATGVTCGSKVCAAGQYCCNASCGICAAPGVACIQMACEGAGGASTGGAGTGGASTGGVSTGVGSCTKDTDCRIYDDYCRGCNCRAVPTNVAVEPSCRPADMVQCLVEPCLKKRAACTNGQCTVSGQY